MSALIDSIKNILNPELIRYVPGATTFDEAFEAVFLNPKADVQRALAPLLRAMTINHERTSNSPNAKQARATYQELFNCGVFARSHDDYLVHQGTDTVWATEVEAAALAEVLDFTVLVTPVNRGIPQSTLIPRKSNDNNRPIINLYNGDNIHWYLDDGYHETIGDGNCLYNAFAKYLAHIVVEETRLEHNASANQDNSDGSPAQSPCDGSPAQSPLEIGMCKFVYRKQDELLASIKNVRPTPIKEIFDRVKNVINESEKTDHLFALKLAQQEAKKHVRRESIGVELKNNLRIMKAKARELREQALSNPDRYSKAADTAEKLVSTMIGVIRGSRSKQDCLQAIFNAREELETHRGWKQLLGNVALLVAGFVFVYACAAAYNKWTTGNFLFFNETDSGTKLNALEISVKNDPALKLPTLAD